MPATNSDWGGRTTGQMVVEVFPQQVKDKIILITGANPGGIGGSTATSLAVASPKLLILAGRGQARLAETIENIKKVNPAVTCKPLILDLSSQESCRKAAKEVMEASDVPHIDVLINNAGVMDIQERTLSPEGIEMQFATNHIGHFIFTNLIFPKVAAAAKTAIPGATRIINLSSRAVVYGPVRFSDYNFTKCEKDLPESDHMSKEVRAMWNEHEDKPYIPQAAYVHPGAVSTDLARHLDPEKLKAAIEGFKKTAPGMFWKDLEQGCSTTLVAALDPKNTKDDILWADCHVAGWAPEWSTDPGKAEQLWKLSEQLVGQEFSY
ncbi:hypothetical protein LTR24_004803 [Lithohypha guttulata]|uniref:Uncharacterized protein n=1 Tax=Lithohypha guttulata TaxID=1690604 RepID=A0ABR0KBC7_9EURO|nr:hypothetical protein LTR24_004803 [Lithohypha guttulata]